jgi:hypothetical protein
MHEVSIDLKCLADALGQYLGLKMCRCKACGGKKLARKGLK